MLDVLPDFGACLQLRCNLGCYLYDLLHLFLEQGPRSVSLAWSTMAIFPACIMCRRRTCFQNFEGSTFMQPCGSVVVAQYLQRAR